MGKADAVRAVGELMAAFRPDNVKPETVDVYASHLQNIDPDVLSSAVTHIIRKSKFFPSVSEVIDSCLAVCGALPPTPAEVLALVRQADKRVQVMRRDGSFAYEERYWEWPEGAPEEVLELAQETLAKVGEPCDSAGKAYFSWETGFQKTYEQVAEQAKVELLGRVSQLRLPANEPKRLYP